MSDPVAPGGADLGVDDKDWQRAKQQFMEAEERRFDLATALARQHEKELKRSFANGMPQGEKGKEAEQLLQVYLQQVSQAFCPLERLEHAKCQEENKADMTKCQHTSAGLIDCLERYAQIGNLPFLQRFAMGLRLGSGDN
eukprot:Rhum_TRINITY_DN12327_c0_g1::Rhum_TRINITY_DN12327_c0_g1_i1::g.51083::m.51083